MFMKQFTGSHIPSIIVSLSLTEAWRLGSQDTFERGTSSTWKGEDHQHSSTVSPGRQVGAVALTSCSGSGTPTLKYTEIIFACATQPRYRVISHDVHQVVILRPPAKGPNETRLGCFGWCWWSSLQVSVCRSSFFFYTNERSSSGGQVLELATSQTFSNRSKSKAIIG